MTGIPINPLISTEMQFIHIDEFLQDSRQQWWQWGGFLLLVAGVLAMVSLPISYRILLILLCMVAVGFTQFSHTHLVAMSTLATASRLDYQTQTGIDNLEWQLAVVPNIALTEFFTPIKNNTNQAQLWQGQLLTCHHFASAVVLSFAIHTPMPRRLTATLWQDQMSENAWRQLVSLARLHR